MEDTLFVILRLLLAGVFVVSAVGKLLDRPGSRAALVGFGVPERYIPTIVWLLPATEIAIAALLLPASTALWGGIAALALLLVFTAAIAYNLAKGRTPDCHCFGAVASEPIGPSTLIRNGVLMAMAATIVGLGLSETGPSTVAWIEDLGGAQAAGLLLLAAVTGLLALLVASTRSLQKALSSIDDRVSGIAGLLAKDGESGGKSSIVEHDDGGLPIGTPAPSFTLDGIYGETGTLDALRSSGHPVLLVFSSPNCNPCNALMPDIGRWQRELSQSLTVAVIGRGEAAANRAKSAEHGLRNVLLQRAGEVADLYRVPATPMAVLIDDEGNVASPIAGGTEAIRALVDKFAAEIPAQSDSLEILSNVAAQSNEVEGNAQAETPIILVEEESPAMETTTDAPAAELTDLDGNPIILADVLTDNSVLLFWSTTCGYCTRMLDDLKAWEQDRPPDAPTMIVISRGTAEDNIAQGISSRVLLDQTFSVGSHYRAGGTPTAVRVDSIGEPISEHAVGGANIIALLNGEDPPEPEPMPEPIVLEIGQVPPPFTLNNLADEVVSLSDYAGRETIVMFWSPGCVHCQRMVDDLVAWESNLPDGAPELVVISSGDIEANKAAGLKSQVLIDSGFATGKEYGASGTPSGIAIGADGLIASGTVVGAPGLFKLLKYVSVGCQECLDACAEQGGGEACRMVCEMSGQCY